MALEAMLGEEEEDGAWAANPLAKKRTVQKFRRMSKAQRRQTLSRLMPGIRGISAGDATLGAWKSNPLGPGDPNRIMEGDTDGEDDDPFGLDELMGVHTSLDDAIAQEAKGTTAWKGNPLSRSGAGGDHDGSTTGGAAAQYARMDAVARAREVERLQLELAQAEEAARNRWRLVRQFAPTRKKSLHVTAKSLVMRAVQQFEHAIKNEEVMEDWQDDGPKVVDELPQAEALRRKIAALQQGSQTLQDAFGMGGDIGMGGIDEDEGPVSAGEAAFGAFVERCMSKWREYDMLE